MMDVPFKGLQGNSPIWRLLSRFLLKKQSHVIFFNHSQRWRDTVKLESEASQYQIDIKILYYSKSRRNTSYLSQPQELNTGKKGPSSASSTRYQTHYNLSSEIKYGNRSWASPSQIINERVFLHDIPWPFLHSPSHITSPALLQLDSNNNNYNVHRSLQFTKPLTHLDTSFIGQEVTNTWRLPFKDIYPELGQDLNTGQSTSALSSSDERWEKGLDTSHVGETGFQESQVYWERLSGQKEQAKVCKGKEAGKPVHILRTCWPEACEGAQWSGRRGSRIQAETTLEGLEAALPQAVSSGLSLVLAPGLVLTCPGLCPLRAWRNGLRAPANQAQEGIPSSEYPPGVSTGTGS
ncbi:hypothetical protein H8959_020871 [Pygathrix nigripes]